MQSIVCGALSGSAVVVDQRLQSGCVERRQKVEDEGLGGGGLLLENSGPSLGIVGSSRWRRKTWQVGDGKTGGR